MARSWVGMHWKPPLVGWLSLNIDGACKENIGLAWCGGLVRDEWGRWICGFSKRIENCSAFEADLWGVWDRGISRLVVREEAL